MDIQKTAMRLARYFDMSAAVWLRLQVRYDLEVAERKLSKRISREVKVLRQRADRPRSQSEAVMPV